MIIPQNMHKVTLHLAKFTSQSVICFRNIAPILAIDIMEEYLMYLMVKSTIENS